MSRDLPYELALVGFYATAADVRAGRIDIDEVRHRLLRDAPNRQPENRERVLALAERLGCERDFIERLEKTEGPLRLEPWQREVVDSLMRDDPALADASRSVREQARRLYERCVADYQSSGEGESQ